MARGQDAADINEIIESYNNLETIALRNEEKKETQYSP